MIEAVLNIHADCDGNHLDGCHDEISTSAEPIINDLSQDAYQEWLEENGWLVLGEGTVFCPVCRLEFHD
jgi:hypothetical protein